MGKNTQYRKHAADARDSADSAISTEDKASWLRLAQSWLMMIRGPNKAESVKFDVAEAYYGTNQKKSDSEH